MNWDSLWTDVLAQLLPVIGLVLLTLTSWAIHKLGRRLGIDAQSSLLAAIDESARRAVVATEEWGARKLKVDEKPVAGAEKAAHALRLLRATWPRASESSLLTAIDTALAATAGLGATKVAVGKK